MAVRSVSNLRYNNYGHYPPPVAERTPRSAVSCSDIRQQPPSPTSSSINGRLQISNGLQQEPVRRNSTSTSGRLEYIINSMAYIRGELDDLKESDRVLLEIFKQLESNVAELNDSISTWRAGGGNTPGRPTSFTDLDFGTNRSSYCANPPPIFNGGLETILDSSKEDISYKASHESDSLYLPENDSSSLSCSPILPSLKSHASVPSISSGGSSGAARRPLNPSPPQLTTSTSFNQKLASSPSISRLQDETSSNISRNSSIDSGIQFASEAENGSTHGGVEPMSQGMEHTSQGVEPTSQKVEPVAASSSLLTVPSSGAATEDNRKSVGFADDIFAALGL